MSWTFHLPDGDWKSPGIMLQPITIANDGTVYLCHANGNIYAFNSKGEVVWQLSLDHSFKTHPLLLPNGDLVVVGDKAHEVEFPDMASIMSNIDDMGSGGNSTFDLESWDSEMEEMFANLMNYQRELLSLPGYLFVLSSAGKVLMQQQLPSSPITGPLVLGDSKLLLNIIGKVTYPTKADPLSIIEISGRLMCITVEGEILWDKSFDTGFAQGGIQIANLPGGEGKYVLAVGDDGNLYSLDEAGELLWAITGTEIDPNSLVAGPDGLIYVVEAGELVCYKWEG